MEKHEAFLKTIDSQLEFGLFFVPMPGADEEMTQMGERSDFQSSEAFPSEETLAED